MQKFEVLIDYRLLSNCHTPFTDNLFVLLSAESTRAQEAYERFSHVCAKEKEEPPKRTPNHVQCRHQVCSSSLIHLVFICRMISTSLSFQHYSRLLGEIWNKADEDEKKPFLEREEKERKVYRAKMESWKADQKVAAAMAIPAACPEANAARTFYQPEMREEPSTSHEKSGAESSFHREDAASFTKEEASHVNDGKFKFYQISLVFSSHIFDAYISCIYLSEHYLPTPYAEGNQETFHINNCANYSYDSRNQGQSKTPSNLYNSCCGYPTQRSNVKYIYPRPDVERPYSI